MSSIYQKLRRREGRKGDKLNTHEPLTTGTKECVKCKRVLHVLAFSANKKSSDGLYSYCRDCHGEQQKKERQRKGMSKMNENHLKFIYQGEI